MKIAEKYAFAIDFFLNSLPDAQTELHYQNSYQLLVAVILSAQCTDKRVNLVTPELFAKYPDFPALASAEAEEIFPLIRSISYPNSKAKYLAKMARQIMTDFAGVIPQDMQALQSLPGVGRKTANVILSVLYQSPNMAVDTHVFRVARRIGLVANSDNTPLKVEKRLLRYLPSELVYKAHHWLILHGRYTCLAKKAKCEECGLKPICRDWHSRHKAGAKFEAAVLP